MSFRVWSLFLCLLLPGCFLSRESVPRVRFDLDANTKFVHRGMVQNDNAVLQPGMEVSMDTVDGGQFHVGAWGNLDLRNSTGSAWFPNGHEGRFSQIDTRAAYSQSFETFDLRLGVDNYNLPNGTKFPFGVRGSTVEVSAVISGEFMGTMPALEIHYDIDEVTDFFVRGVIAKSIPMEDDLTFNAELGLGWSGSDHSMWAYGIQKSGLADLSAKLGLDYWLDDNTVTRVTLGGSMLVDDTLEKWVDLIGIDTDVIWVGVGATWFF